MQRLIDSLAVFVLAVISLPILIDSAIKGLAVLAAVGLVVLWMRRSSAASRHFAWAAGMIGLLVLPILAAVLPQWRILPSWMNVTLEEGAVPIGDMEPTVSGPVPAVPVEVPAAQFGVEPAPISRDGANPVFLGNGLAQLSARPDEGISISNWAVAIWLGGAGILLLRLLVCQGGLVLLRFKSQPAGEGALPDQLRFLSQKLRINRRATLLLSDQRSIPMTWGIVWPHILLPTEALEWPVDRQKAVLLHELAHVRRHDCLTQLLVQLACALHWFNPLVWVAAWRIEVERERACDDSVLSHGFGAPDYAEHVLNIGSTFKESFTANTVSVAMARPRGLESRLQTILDATLNRARPRRSILVLSLLAFVAALLPVSMMRAVEGVDSLPSFKPVVERVLTGVKNEWMLDLDSGRTHGPVDIGGETLFPTGMDLSVPYWKRGDDFAVASVAGVNGLGVIPAPNDDWNISLKQLRSRLKPSLAGRVIGASSGRSSRLADSETKLPRTFLFRTGEGSEGVLQLLAFTEAPGGVKIRYKLVSSLNSGALGASRQVIESVIDVGRTGKFFDLDLAKEHGPVVIGGDTTIPETWDISIPMMARKDGTPVPAVVARSMDVVPLDVGKLDSYFNLNLTEVRELLGPSKRKSVVGGDGSVERIVGPDDGWPRVFAFRTRQGGEGVLAVRLGSKPREIFLKYLLFPSATRSAATPEPEPESSLERTVRTVIHGQELEESELRGLLWGEAKSGLQAAHELEPKEGVYSFGDEPAIRFYVRNVSDEAITFHGARLRPGDQVVVFDNEGNPAEVDHAKTSVDFTPQRYLLKPGAVVELEGGELGIAAKSTQQETGRFTLRCEPGVYSVRFNLRLIDLNREFTGGDTPSSDDVWMLTGETSIKVGVPTTVGTDTKAGTETSEARSSHGRTPFPNGSSFRVRLPDEGGLDLDTGQTRTPWQDTDGRFLGPEGIDVAWDDDQGGLLHVARNEGQVKILALPDAKDFADAAIKARQRVDRLSKSLEGACAARDSRFVAVLTGQRNLAVIVLTEFSGEAGVIAWSLGEIRSQGGAIEVQPVQLLPTATSNSDSKRADGNSAKPHREFPHHLATLSANGENRYLCLSDLRMHSAIPSNAPVAYLKKRSDLGLCLVVENAHNYPTDREQGTKLWESMSAEEAAQPAGLAGLPFERNGVYPVRKEEMPTVVLIPGYGLLRVRGIDDRTEQVIIDYKQVTNETGRTTRNQPALPENTAERDDSPVPDPDDPKRRIVIPDVDKAGAKVVLDLASGELLPAGPGQRQLLGHFADLGKGDLAWDRVLIALRGGTVKRLGSSGEWEELKPKEQRDDAAAYDVAPILSNPLLVTTAEDRTFLVSVLQASDEQITIEYAPVAEQQSRAGPAVQTRKGVARTGDSRDDSRVASLKERLIGTWIGGRSLIPVVHTFRADGTYQFMIPPEYNGGVEDRRPGTWSLTDGNLLSWEIKDGIASKRIIKLDKDSLELSGGSTFVFGLAHRVTNRLFEASPVSRDDFAAAGITLNDTSDVATSGNLFSSVAPQAVNTGDSPSRRVLFSNNVLTEVPQNDVRLQDSLVEFRGTDKELSLYEPFRRILLNKRLIDELAEHYLEVLRESPK